MYSLFKSVLLGFMISIVSINTYASAQETANNPLTSPYDILQEVMNRSVVIDTMQTNFVQKKHVTFLTNPIETSGYLYFAKHKNNKYSLLWEYNAPSLSGLWSHNESTLVWTQSRGNIRAPQGHEKEIISIMIQQLIFWLKIDFQEIASRYKFELVAERTIKLTPKRKDIFQFIIVTFREDFQGLEKLILDEGAGNFISLSFFETEYNIPKLEISPNGTPFP